MILGCLVVPLYVFLLVVIDAGFCDMTFIVLGLGAKYPRPFKIYTVKWATPHYQIVISPSEVGVTVI